MYEETLQQHQQQQARSVVSCLCQTVTLSVETVIYLYCPPVSVLCHFFVVRAPCVFGCCTKLLVVLFWRSFNEFLLTSVINKCYWPLGYRREENVERGIFEPLGSVCLTSTIASHSEVTKIVHDADPALSEIVSKESVNLSIRGSELCIDNEVEHWVQFPSLHHLNSLFQTCDWVEIFVHSLFILFDFCIWGCAVPLS